MKVTKRGKRRLKKKTLEELWR